ncbi:MAG: PAS domain-containing sensor histidine kinase [Chitinophagales bacterium]|nr:PAS domain-containing sensor histidine kinase [Chitinophagales bacterium]
MPSRVKYDYKTLFENTSVGIVISDVNGRIIDANPYSADLFGYDLEEFLELYIKDLLPENSKNKHAAHHSAYNAHPKARVMGMGLDIYGMKKDKSIFPLEISLNPFEKDGERYTTSFIVDITLRKKWEEELKKQNQKLELVKQELQLLNQELEEKVEARTFTLKATLQELRASRNEIKDALTKEKELGELKSRFVSMASHEFRTPLSTILSSASLIHRYLESGQIDKCDKHINRIKSSVEHLNSVLDDFLSIGRIEEGLIKLNFEEFDVYTEVENIVVEMRELSKSHQKIELINKGSATIITDKHLLKIAFSNLLSNAIKFSPVDGLIVVTTEKKQKSVILTVKDNGVGIPEAEQKRLFIRFFRASNVQNIQGTGLGLYIVKRYMNLIGGQINIQSVANEGTSISIELPL